VETVLGEHPAVQEVVVVAREESTGDKRLVAYVVPKHERPIHQEELRTFVEAKLPAYLVPAQFMQLERMPLTPSGKADRSLLPSPEELEGPCTRTSVTPTNDTESALVSIWRELLACKTVGIHDNFFHLGGHSLLVTQLVSRIMSTFQIEVPVRVVFESPTIAALAKAIDGVQPNEAPPLSAISKGMSQAAARDLLRRVNDLTDTEVEELLRAPGLQHVSS
jgi:hypothetical protein